MLKCVKLAMLSMYPKNISYGWKNLKLQNRKLIMILINDYESDVSNLHTFDIMPHLIHTILHTCIFGLISSTPQKILTPTHHQVHPERGLKHPENLRYMFTI